MIDNEIASWLIACSLIYQFKQDTAPQSAKDQFENYLLDNPNGSWNGFITILRAELKTKFTKKARQ